MSTHHPLMTQRNKFLWLFLVILGIIGVALILLSTHYGAFLSDDSYFYIEPARSALLGNGFNPSPTFAPLLPAVLLLLGKLGAEPLTAVRYLNAFLFGLNIILTGAIAKGAGLSDLFAGLTALLVVLSNVLLQMYGWAMSEALYQTLILVSVFLFALYLKRPSYLWLILTAVAAALACLTRYAALPLVLTLVVILLIYDTTRPFLSRLWRSVVLGFISLAPIGAYLVRNILVSGRATHYHSFSFVPFTMARLTWYLYNTLDWFVPGRFINGHEIIAGVLFACLLIGAGIITYRIHRSQRLSQDGSFAITLLWITFIVLNFLMLFLAGGLSGLTADNTRYLAPIFWAFLFILVYFLDLLWKTGSQPARFLVTIFSLLFIVYNADRSYTYLKSTYDAGLGYSGVGWYTSETITYLKRHPNIEVVSTGDMGIYFWTGKLPASITAFGGAAGLRQHLCQTGASLFILNSMPVDIYHMNLQDITQGLTLVYKFNDSSMYQCK